MLIILTLFLALFASHSAGQLSSTFYDNTCSNLTSVVRNVIQQAVNDEARMAGSILRLHFHDCFVQGCDASILLDGSSLEQEGPGNKDSARGYDVIDNVKTAVESACPGVVSCADILALSAREAVVAQSGPSWTVVFGRRDSTSAASSTGSLPPPTLTASELISNFGNQGLSVQDMVALSGAHTIGQAQCRTFKTRLYNPATGDQMDSSFNSSLQANCPASGGDGNLSPLDLQTPVRFDNSYYKNLQDGKGLLFSDQTLYSGGQSNTRSLVDTYAGSQNSFFSDFTSAMVNMGNLNPLTGSSGEIRRSCGTTN